MTEAEYKKATVSLIEDVSQSKILKPLGKRAILSKCSSSLAIRCSPNYTLPVCEKRVFAALDAAQRGSDVLARELPVNPNRLKSWNPKDSLTQIYRQSTFQEASQYARKAGMTDLPVFSGAFQDGESGLAAKWAKERGDQMGHDPVMDIRQSLAHFALACERDQSKRIVMQDKSNKVSAITIRILEAKKTLSGEPMMLVLYRHNHRDQLAETGPPYEAMRWISHAQQTYGGVANNVATEEEQAMMLRLLELNSARIDPTYRPKRDRHEENFKLSFLLPVLPLDGAALARLEKADACRVCGDMKTSGMKRCSRCKGEDASCSATCQKADYPNHKASCRAIASSGSLEFTLHKPPKGAVPYNRFSTVRDFTKEPKAADNGNVHGNNLFLAKVQLSLPRDDLPPQVAQMAQFANAFGSALVYDARRSFTMMIWQIDSPKDFAKLQERIKKDGLLGKKLYVWAQRTAEDKIRILHEHLPNQDVPW